MKKIAGLVVVLFVLVGTLSTASMADGGAPPPLCLPWDCPPGLAATLTNLSSPSLK
jgi:hypothetical protein